MDQAEGDLAHAKSDMERGFYDWSCFSSQQAGEKAVFQKMGAEAWGHSVADLLKELSRRHRVLPGPDIPRRRRGGSLPMRRRSSSSVHIFYPKFDKEEIILGLSERLKELEEKLPLVHVVLFGSYAEGNYTVGSDVDILVV